MGQTAGRPGTVFRRLVGRSGRRRLASGPVRLDPGGCRGTAIHQSGTQRIGAASVLSPGLPDNRPFPHVGIQRPGSGVLGKDRRTDPQRPRNRGRFPRFKRLVGDPGLRAAWSLRCRDQHLGVRRPVPGLHPLQLGYGRGRHAGTEARSHRRRGPGGGQPGVLGVGRRLCRRRRHIGSFNLLRDGEHRRGGRLFPDHGPGKETLRADGPGDIRSCLQST